MDYFYSRSRSQYEYLSDIRDGQVHPVDKPWLEKNHKDLDSLILRLLSELPGFEDYSEDGDEREYDSEGYDQDGFDREGYDEEGYDFNGFDRDGYDYDGLDREGNPRS